MVALHKLIHSIMFTRRALPHSWCLSSQNGTSCSAYKIVALSLMGRRGDEQAAEDKVPQHEAATNRYLDSDLLLWRE